MRISDWSSDVCSSDLTILVARCRSPSPHVRLPITGCAGATARGAVPRGLRGLVALGSSKHCLPGLLSVEADSASTSPADCGLVVSVCVYQRVDEIGVASGTLRGGARPGGRGRRS